MVEPAMMASFLRIRRIHSYPAFLDPLAQLDGLSEDPLVLLGHLVPVLDDGGEKLDEFRHLHRIGEDDPRLPLRLRQVPEALNGGGLVRLGVVDEDVEAHMVHQEGLLELCGDDRFEVRGNIGEGQPFLEELMVDGGGILQEDDIGSEVPRLLFGQDLRHDLGGIHVETVHLDPRELLLEGLPELVDPGGVGVDGDLLLALGLLVERFLVIAAGLVSAELRFLQPLFGLPG